MLLFSSRDRVATQRNPEREARFLYLRGPAPRPEETPSTPGGPGGRNGVDGTIQGNRANIASTMEGGEAEKLLSVEVVAGDIAGAREHALETQQLMQQYESTAKAHLDKPMWGLWKEHDIFLGIQGGKLQKAIEATEKLQAFANGETSPALLARDLRSAVFQDFQDNDVRVDLSSVVSTAAETALERRSEELGGTITWETADASTRQAIASEILALPWLQALLITLQQTAAMTEATIADSNIEKVLGEIGKRAKNDEAGVVADGGIGWHSIGIEWHSVSDIWEGLKTTWEAITSAWERRHRLHGARAARMFGAAAKLLPIIGTDVEQALQSNLQNKEKEEQETYFNYLDRLKFSYAQVLAFVSENASDYNRVQGAVKYAASRGWLYEYYRNSKPTSLLGVSVASICSNMSENDASNYVSLTQQNNEKGGRQEVEDTKGRERQNNNLEEFEKALRAELKDLNLWGAVGVAQAALARGRDGHTGPLMATIVINELRANPRLQALMSPEILDGMFAWSLAETPFVLSRLQGERNKLAPWLKNGAKKEKIMRAGPLAGVIGTVERRIARFSLKQEENDRIVGKVLAGMTVSLEDGSHVSIFDNYPAFNVYRKEISKNDYKLPDVKGADDYFSVNNGRSEIVYAPEGWVRYLVQIDSNGGLAYGTQAENLFIQFCNIHDELAGAGMGGALHNFRAETSEKIGNGLAGGQRKDLLPGLQTKYIYVGGEKISIAQALRDRGLLTDEAIRFIWPTTPAPPRQGRNGAGAAEQQLQQAA